MRNFLERMVERSKRRAASPLVHSTVDSETSALRRLNAKLNESFFLEATCALVDTGLDAAITEIGKELREKGALGVYIFTPSTDIHDVSYTPDHNYGNMRYKDGTLKAITIIREVGWDTEGSASDHSFCRIGHGFAVYFHSDGTLEFISNVGDKIPSNPLKGPRAQVLSRDQWFSDSELLSRCLESAYKHPRVSKQTFIRDSL